MELSEKIELAISMVYGKPLLEGLKKLGLSTSRYYTCIRKNLHLPDYCYERLSDEGINIQWIFNDKYTSSAFNTSDAGFCLSKRFPLYAPSVYNNTPAQMQAIDRLAEWIDTYVGSKEKFLDYCNLPDDKRNIWQMILIGLAPLGLDEIDMLTRNGVNPEWLFTADNSGIDPISDSKLGILMKLLRDSSESKTTAHPVKMTREQMLKINMLLAP